MTAPPEVDPYLRLGDLISWMFYRNRRPGLLGVAERITGVADGRPAELRRDGEGWLFLIGGEVVARFEEPGEALSVIPEHSFVYDSAIVTARIADMLFQGAVEQAEEGLRLYWESLALSVRSIEEEKAKELIEPNFLQQILAVPINDPVDFAVVTSILDRLVRRSLSSIQLAFSAAEAQVNDWADQGGGWQNREDFETLVRKMKLAAQKLGGAVDIGASPFQEMQSLVEYRHDITHPKPVEQQVTLGRTEAPGRGPSIQARKTCYYVRACLVSIARSAGLEPPRYLAYCPPGPFEDDEVWRSAAFLTGTRADPDFPRVGDPAPDQEGGS